MRIPFLKLSHTRIGLFAIYFRSGYRLPYRRIENWWSKRLPDGRIKLTVVVHPDRDYTTYITEAQMRRFIRWCGE